MKPKSQILRGIRSLLAGTCLLSMAAVNSYGQSSQELQQRVRELTRELEATKQQLAASEQKRASAERIVESNPDMQKLAEVEEKLANAADTGPSKITPGDLIPALEGLTIGGAIRVNYAIGDYGDSTGGPSRASGDGGDFDLDTFRINADYSKGQFVGKLEYRFYDPYHMLHTGWLGYNFDNQDQLQVGVNRVPFGPGAYGISQSFFFDQHYYVGLSDDMDLGIKYSGTRGDLSFDFAYYYSDEGQWGGNSKQSARYSYDAVVDNTGVGYEEENQFNARVIYATNFGDVNVDLGFSAQYGQLDGHGTQDNDGDHYAVSIHPVFKLDNWTFATQLTKYEYNVSEDIVNFGAFDYNTGVAAEAWVAGASLSYYYEINAVDWVDYVIPFVEYSSIIKDESGFNDSDLFTIGAAWGRGGWYIYTEYAGSTGNDFIGGEDFSGGRFGANTDDSWESRFNINFGYYF